MATPLFVVTTSPAMAATSVTLDGTSGGRTFDGIGAISGGGGNSRLLVNYPEPQRSQLLDYLFKPGYGADLQILKTEIGGDANSTDGAEASIEHTRGVVNCNAGYEMWLMEQAKARNPSIKLYALAWAAPGWISGGFWSTDTINYLITYLNCAKGNGLTINYLGGWNERGYNAAWYEQLRTALNNNGYSALQIVGDDSGWDEADQMVTDQAFNNSIQVLGAHYPCGGDGGAALSCSSTANAVATGKPLWASENGSQDMNAGTPALIRSITRGYLDAKMTAYINWPLLAAIYPNLPYDTVGLSTAPSPWSGAYTIGSSTWATAQVTQFTAPGWKFLDASSGYLGGNRTNGSYVTLKSTNGSDYSTIAETTTATAAQTVTFNVKNGLSSGTVHVWTTNLGTTSTSDDLLHSQDITPVNGSYTLTLQPNYIYSLTTTTGQGKGAAAGPAPTHLALPYTDTYDAAPTGSQAWYMADMQGSYEIHPCLGGRSGQCVQQMAAQMPIEWQNDSDAYTLLGDTAWSNYTVGSDVFFTQAGTLELLGRAGTQTRPQSNQAGYWFRMSDTGGWSVLRSSSTGQYVTLASGTTTAPGTGSWHRLSMQFQGATITVSLDNVVVKTLTDSTYVTGMVGLGVVGYQTDQFDNLSITPGTGTAVPSGPVTSGVGNKCLDNDNSNAPGTPAVLWDCTGGANQSWVLTSGTLQNNGSCLDVAAAGTANGTLVEQYACNGGANQQWSLQNGMLVSAQSGRCLDDPNSSTTNGVQLVIWDCGTGQANQHWTLASSGPPTGLVASGVAGKCIDDDNSNANGTPAIIWDCNSSNGNQVWTFVNGTLQQNGECLDVTALGTANGTKVEQWSCTGASNQQWTHLANGELVSAASGRCLDDPALSTTNGTQLDIWDCDNGANQHWTFSS